MTNPCGPPDGKVDVATDVMSLFDKFANRPGALTKARSDLHPGVVDFRITIMDVVLALRAFTGQAYPFTPSLPPCPLPELDRVIPQH